MARLIINPTAANRREIGLSRDEILTIGRDPSNDLVLPDAMVSRRHAVIEQRGSQFFLRDCDSANGSVVNGDRVSERGLRDGDLVAIGSMRLLFREEPVEPGAKVVPHPSAAPLHCPDCGADYRRGDLFCRDCGAQVARPSGPPRAVCSSCGSAIRLPARFCNACGKELPEGEAPPAEAAEVAEVAGAAELATEAEGEEDPAVPSDTPPPSRPATGSSPALVRPGQSAAHAPLLPPEPSLPPPSPAARPTRELPPEDLPPREAPRQLPPAVRTRRPPPPPAHRSGPPRSSPHRSTPHRSSPPPRRPRAPEPPAGFGARLAAGLVDAVFVLSGQAVMVVPAGYYWWSRDLPRTPGDVPFLPIVITVALVTLAFLLGVLYNVYFWGVRGTSPGKELLELQVETEDGRCPIGLGKATLRVLGYMLSTASLGIGFLMIAAGGDGLHDRIAGTRVVRRDRS